MAKFELVMPKMGESVAEATIIKWLKQEGDMIEAEESVLEIATDKVDSEVPAPVDGKLVKCMFAEDEVVEVGQVIAILETEADAAGSDEPSAPAPEESSAPAEAAVAEARVSEAVAKTVNGNVGADIPREANGRFYSPLVRSIAKEENISVEELQSIEGSGENGRVTKKDILEYVEHRGSNGKAVASAPAAPAAKVAADKTPAPGIQAPPVSMGEGDEIIEMDRMRKLIAEHMVMSKHVSPHVTSFVEVDVTNIVNWRNRIKNEFQKREGEKITFTPIFVEALARAIKDFPMINISVDGDRMIKRKHINIGMAAALPSGNLIVPVIKDADRLNLLGITKVVNDLAGRARTNKLKPEEIQGGTYTLTNVGTFGNVLGTPIINQPQVAIMATGAIVKKPAVLETAHGDVIAIRHKMFLSHSYDHRVVDGALGGSFVRRVADYLEAFDPDRSI